jgi:hypothetical protein
MSRENLLIIFGLVVALAPFMGLPISWLSVLLPLCGVMVVIIGWTVRSRRKALSASQTDTPSVPA